MADFYFLPMAAEFSIENLKKIVSKNGEARPKCILTK